MKYRSLVKTGLIVSVICTLQVIFNGIYHKFFQVYETTNTEQLLNSTSNGEYALARFQARGGYIELYNNITIAIVIIIILIGIYRFLRINNIFKRNKK